MPKGDSGPTDGGPVRRSPKGGRPRSVRWPSSIYAGSMSALSAQEAPSRQNEADATSPNMASWTHMALGVETENRASGFGGALSFSKAPLGTLVLMAGRTRLDCVRYGIRPFGQRGGIMSQLLSKFRVALAGAAVVVVVGLATPSILGAVSVAIWSHGGAFDVSGADHLGLCLLDAIAWSAWARIAVGLGSDVVSGLRGRNDLVRSGSVRGVLAGWVVGLALMVLPSLGHWVEDMAGATHGGRACLDLSDGAYLGARASILVDR